MSPHTQSLHAYLFATAEPARVATLAKRLALSEDEIRAAIAELTTLLAGSGVVVIHNGDEITLGTAPDQHALIESIRKEELSKELSKASAETLSIIAYLPGVHRSQIEFIRGVNVSYTLRALLVRGLIEARSDGRVSAYYPTTAFLQTLGATTPEELPEYLKTRETLTALLATDNTSTS